MKFRLLWIGTLATLLFVGALVVAGTAPDEIILDGCGEKKSAVAFPHAAHLELTECTTCHHTAEGLTADSGTEVKSCKSCHLNPEDAATPSCSEMSLSKNPYHKLCISCHKEQAKGPAKCNDCHPKE
jgi:hypothetical protein